MSRRLRAQAMIFILSQTIAYLGARGSGEPAGWRYSGVGLMCVFEKASHPVRIHRGRSRIGRWASLPAAAALALLMIGQAARADLLVQIDKTTQRMTVTVNGQQLYKWPVATGGIDYDTPNGAFRPFRMEIDHYSDEWDNAPMPYSIFFTTIGNAIHGTYEQRSLGHPVSHGCVRLSLANAATLWGLVKQQKMANTTVVITGEIPGVDPAKVVHVDPSNLAFGKPLSAPDPTPRPPAAPGFSFPGGRPPAAPDFFSLFH